MEEVHLGCRHALMQRWWNLKEAAVKQGRLQARRLEQVYWEKYQAAVTVTASGRVMDANGKSFMPIQLEARAS